MLKSKHRDRNNQDLPDIYEQFNDSIQAAQPGEDEPGNALPRLPLERDFPENIETRIIARIPREDIQYAIVVLHGYNADHTETSQLATKHLLGPRTVCILVRGPNRIESERLPKAFGWSDKTNRRGSIKLSSSRVSLLGGPSRSNATTTAVESIDKIEDRYKEQEKFQSDNTKATFQESTRYIGLKVIVNVLIKKCGFVSRDIALVGYGQGGSAALAVAAACWKARLGGVVSIGGQLPSDFPGGAKAQTPVLLLGGKLGEICDREVARVRSAFCETADGREKDKYDNFEDINDEKLREFLSYQFKGEEWRKEAVITFDGGGIRGYGTLLMLKELMARIGQKERELDQQRRSNSQRLLSESSFSPCEYPPTEINGRTVPQRIEYLDIDQLYLPCHYFTFVGGTSTGGLIGIMISRLRMTVHDCIKEYERLGNEVFGNPRLFTMSRLLWHKFNADNLKRVISEVSIRHGETADSRVRYPSNEALCKTSVVVARGDAGNGMTTLPFMLRTYDCPVRDAINLPLNAGLAAPCTIVEVGRATSAAPRYFRPIEVKNWGVAGYSNEKIELMDGGFGTNNPSFLVLNDIKYKSLEPPNEVVEVFASFGTGSTSGTHSGKLSNLFRLHNEMKTEMTDVRRTHEAMAIASGIDSPDSHANFRYFRFDGGEDLGLIPMDQWSGRRKSQLLRISREQTGRKTLAAIKEATDKYLRDPQVQQNLTDLARILVLRRRFRTRDYSAWERYACASRYECSQAECEAKLDALEDFRSHLAGSHNNLSEEDHLTVTRESRKCWIYRKIEGRN